MQRPIANGAGGQRVPDILHHGQALVADAQLTKPLEPADFSPNRFHTPFSAWQCEARYPTRPGASVLHHWYSPDRRTVRWVLVVPASGKKATARDILVAIRLVKAINHDFACRSGSPSIRAASSRSVRNRTSRSGRNWRTIICGGLWTGANGRSSVAGTPYGTASVPTAP
jgi:hypothetical protein